MRGASRRRVSSRSVRAHFCFMRALLRLVLLERLRRIDVAERRMIRDEVLRGVDAEALREHRAERLDLHLAEARERRDAPSQVGSVACFGPDALGVPAVRLLDDRGELLHAL